MKRILSVILLIALSNVAQAAIYYVDAVNGNDQWSGYLATPQGVPSTDGPWRTVSKVNSTSLAPGDTVLFKCGNTWREQLIITNSGASGSPVTIGSYGSDCGAANKPTINGADVVSGWRLHSGAIYSAKVSSPVRQVFVDGQYVTLAHYPNKTTSGSAFLTIAEDSTPQNPGVSGADYITASSDDSSILNGVDISNAGIHIRTVEWSIEDDVVTGMSGNVIYLQNISTYAIYEGWGYYLENKFWMLDSPGEWFWNKDADVASGLAAETLYIRLPDDGNPSSHLVEATVRDEGITASDDRSLHINDIAVSNAGRYGVHVSNPEEFTLTNLVVRNTGDTGIFAYESDAVNGNLNDQVIRRVENCEISSSVRQAIHLEKISYVTVTGNKISETGTIGSPVAGVGAVRAGYKSGNTVISNNTVMSSGYNGITFGGDTTIQNNLVYDSCTILGDCGAIYTFNGATNTYFVNGDQVKDIPAVNSRVVGNIVDGVGEGVDGTPRTSRDNYGIYLDNFSNAIEVSGNTVLNTGAGIHTNNAFNNYIHDNTIYGASRAQMDMAEGSAVPYGTVQGIVNGNSIPHRNTISNNILFPVGNVPDVLLSNIPASSTADNFGEFYDNRYSYLYGETVVRDSFSAEYPSGLRPYFKRFTLAEWRADRAQDLSASIVPMFSIAPFKVDTAVTPVEMLGMTFDSDVSPYRVITSGGVASVKWRPESECGNSTSGGCMEFNPVDTSATDVGPADTLLDGGGASFSVEKGATYRVRFKLMSKLAYQNLVLRIIGSSWTDIGFNGTENLMGLSNGQVISAGQAWREYAYVFTASEDSAAKVDFWTRFVPGPGPSILIDNLSVEKVKVDFNDPGDDTNIVVNDTSVAKAVSCPDVTVTEPNPARCAEYIDLYGSPVNWSEPLAPFASKIIIWNNNPMKVISTDLVISLKASSTAVRPGGTVSYTIAVTNNGPSLAADVGVTGTLPTCIINSLAAGATATCPSQSVIAETVGVITQSLAVSGAETDTIPGNNTVVVTTSISNSTDIIMKLTDGSSPSPGGGASSISGGADPSSNGGGGVYLETLFLLYVMAVRRVRGSRWNSAAAR